MDPPSGQVTTPIDDFDDFAALDPFFRIIEEGLAGFVDGRHFFDLLAEHVVFEYVISVPGYPRRVEGRRAVAVAVVVTRSWHPAQCSNRAGCRAESSGWELYQ